MSLKELINKFLERTGYLEDNKVLAIVVYGSRVKGNNKESSDLDILIIADKNRNYKAGITIDGIKIDCNIYSFNDLSDIAYDKRLSNNSYFESVLKNGMIIKDSGVLEELEYTLEDIKTIKLRKRKLSLEIFSELKDMYDNFLDTKLIFWYFNILETLRMTYNYLRNCSYISMVKVYDVFLNSDFYKDAYKLKLPESNFISLFLESVTVLDFDMQVKILNSIMDDLGIDIDGEVDYENDKEYFYSDDEIKQELLVIYNKVEKAIEFLSSSHPYANYSYSVLLRQIDMFYQGIYKQSHTKIDEAIKKIDSSSNEEKIKILKEIFGIVEKDYHFDYGNYMLKLKL